MDTLSADEAKERLIQLIQKATDEGKQFSITSDVGNVVVLPEETYENILVTLEFLSTPGLMENVSLPSVEKIEQIPHARELQNSG